MGHACVIHRYSRQVMLTETYRTRPYPMSKYIELGRNLIVHINNPILDTHMDRHELNAYNSSSSLRIHRQV